MKMKKKNLLLTTILAVLLITTETQASPLWTFTPLTSTNTSVPSNSSTRIMYRVTNQSSRQNTLIMSPIQGVAQVTIATGACSNPFVLSKGSSCILTLEALGYQLTQTINNGPIVCQQGSTNQCYRPSEANILHITQAAPITLPSNCVDTGDNNIACELTFDGETNYGFTNMTYAFCRNVQCDYDGTQTTVSCNCLLIESNQGNYSASVSPLNYNASKPVGNTVTSTFSLVNGSNDVRFNCPSGPWANCYGAPCIVTGDTTVTCSCPVVTSAFFAPQESDCTLTNKLLSASDETTGLPIDLSILYMYNTFFNGDIPLG